jgi:glutamate carboxypeptidase
MTAAPSRHTEWLGQQLPAMLALLETLVTIDGGSYDKAGVDRVGEALAAFLEGEGIAVERLPRETYGDVFIARVPAPGNAPIVLMGHRDTVFPKGEPARRPFRIENGRAYGPGVCDMKAGLVMNAFVLAAFRRFGGHDAPLVALFTSDEEIGSPACRGVIEETARGARAVYNAEPGRISGNVVTGRKGGVFMRCELAGKAAHSGANFEAGASAISAMARKIAALDALTDIPRGITVNVGLVSGGQSVNTVAPTAAMEIDLRYIRLADRAEIMEKIGRIVAAEDVPGTSAALAIKGEFYPLEQTPANRTLFGVYQAAAASNGMTLAGEFTGGCADSGFTSAVGAPTICAVGPVGAHAHSPDEFMVVDTFVPRAQALALAIAATPGA